MSEIFETKARKIADARGVIGKTAGKYRTSKPFKREKEDRY